MNPDLTSWWPVATQTELHPARPLARQIAGWPIAVFLDASGQATALPDRCPHRHAPLSQGRVQDGELVCPYHGWQFNAQGRCTRVPGLECVLAGKPLLTSLPVRVAHGMVWVCLQPSPAPTAPPAPTVVNGVDSFWMSTIVQADMLDVAENFLDGFHTHFVHAGWIRRDRNRQRIHAEVHRLPQGIEAVYRDEGLQSGWISRLFESERSVSMGRFLLPGMAEIEYRSPRGLTLLVTLWLTPQGVGSVRVHARVATPRFMWPRWIKHFFLRQLFRVIQEQDRLIVEAAYAQRMRFEQQGDSARPLDTSLDLLGPAIRRLLSGEALDDSFDRKQICWL